MLFLGVFDNAKFPWVVSDDTLRQFAASVARSGGRGLVAATAQRLWGALLDPFILDWDSTVQTKYGNHEGARVGYNPQKRGRKSFHPLLGRGGGHAALSVFPVARR